MSEHLHDWETFSTYIDNLKKPDEYPEIVVAVVQVCRVCGDPRYMRPERGYTAEQMERRVRAEERQAEEREKARAARERRKAAKAAAR